VIKKAEEYMIAAEEANNMYKNLMDSMYDIPIFNTMIKNYIRISKNNESQLNEDFLSQLQNLVITPLNDTYVINLLLVLFFFLNLELLK